LKRINAVNDNVTDLDQHDDFALTQNEIADEELESAASNIMGGAASLPFTYVSGICC
jgi:hypothetical protein